MHGKSSMHEEKLPSDHYRVPEHSAAQILLNQAKKNARPSVPIPVEMYPLFAACGVAVVSLGYFTYRHFAYDKQLRLWKNADLSRVDEVLNKAAEEEKSKSDE
ncbi:hypothetical protein CA3LBN_002074 [Candidozyma haemuli]|uniref:Uncharacterized protein n=1 Tax=Candidozyma haemuli TaxID=45357 RepID=A0ABX8I3T1_9ASCO|nr:hypothetical protein CA3LBN_002074 [[Candida] haemuloni]